MTRAEHKTLWSNPEYALTVRVMAVHHGTDGCTGVPDFYLLGCYEHDIGYATGNDPLGNPITKAECDRRFRWFIQHRSPLGILSPMSWWRWAAVCLLGKWKTNQRKTMNTNQPICLLGLLLCAVVVLAVGGCATTSGETEGQRLDRIGAVAEIAAYTGTSLWLLKNPQDRPKVELVILGLDGLASTNAISPAALHQVLSQLPIKELRSEEGALLIGVAVLLYESELGRMTAVDQGPYVRAVAVRVRNGLARALGQ